MIRALREIADFYENMWNNCDSIFSKIVGFFVGILLFPFILICIWLGNLY